MILPSPLLSSGIQLWPPLAPVLLAVGPQKLLALTPGQPCRQVPSLRPGYGQAPKLTRNLVRNPSLSLSRRQLGALQRKLTRNSPGRRGGFSETLPSKCQLLSLKGSGSCTGKRSGTASLATSWLGFKGLQHGKSASKSQASPGLVTLRKPKTHFFTTVFLRLVCFVFAIWLQPLAIWPCCAAAALHETCCETL